MMNRNLLLFLTWLCPGLGHVLQRSWVRAGVYAGTIYSMMGLGFLLKGRLFVPVHGDVISYLASLANVGLGFIYPVVCLAGGYRGDPACWTSDYGTLFLLTAGLMNLLLLLEVYDMVKGEGDAE